MAGQDVESRFQTTSSYNPAFVTSRNWNVLERVNFQCETQTSHPVLQHLGSHWKRLKIRPFQSFSIFNLGFLQVSHLDSHQPPLSIPTARCSKQGHLCTRNDCRCQLPRCLVSQIPSRKVELTRSMVIMQVVTSGHPFGFNARFQDLPVIYSDLLHMNDCKLLQLV